MVELRLLCPETADRSYSVRRFPCSIGRNPKADICLAEAGIWEAHLQINLLPEGFVLLPSSDAQTLLNGQPVGRSLLRNGDIITAGAVKLQFWLSQTQQNHLAIRETLTWVALGLLCASEIGLIYALLL